MCGVCVVWCVSGVWCVCVCVVCVWCVWPIQNELSGPDSLLNFSEASRKLLGSFTEVTNPRVGTCPRPLVTCAGVRCACVCVLRVWCGVVCGVVCVVWCVVWSGLAWSGQGWSGLVWCGVVWCGVVWRGAVRCGVV